MFFSKVSCFFFFFFNDTATTEIYTLSLHDALPICGQVGQRAAAFRKARAGHMGHGAAQCALHQADGGGGDQRDRKSTRLNSSHLVISYAVFCLKKKKLITIYNVNNQKSIIH